MQFDDLSSLTDDFIKKLLQVDELGLLTDDVIKAIKNSNGHADKIIELIIKYGKDASTAIGTYGNEAAELIGTYGEDAVKYFRDGKSIDQVLEETYGKELKQKAHQLIEDKIINTPGGKGKSMIVCAYDIRTQKIVAEFAGEIPNTISPVLIERANRIGGIGSLGVSERNTVGVCAEFHAINSLLLNGCNIEDIRLTEAIRPRTGEIRPYCDNCKEMFSDIINGGRDNK